MRQLIGSLSLLLGILVGASATVSAQTKAITIEPFIQEVVLTGTDQQKEFFVEITNHTSAPFDFKAQAVDFGSLNETGGLVFAGANAPELVRKYGLANWLIIDSSSQKLASGQKIRLKVKIDNRADLAPGGHYAAVVVSSQQLVGSASDQPRISLQENLSALIFAKKIGGDIYRLKLTSIDANETLFYLPNSLTLHFRNEGNTHLVPRGTATITDSRGKLVSKGIINQDSAIILPERQRDYVVKLARVAWPVWPGRYQLTINYRFDGYDGLRQYQKHSLLLTPAGLLLLLAGLVLVMGVFQNRRVLVRSISTSRRRLRRKKHRR